VSLRIDWKFIVGSLLAIAGLAIPLYLWQVDLSSHSLSLKRISSSALQPATSAQFQDLQVTLNGTRIASPYLSSFELINTGSKPILSSDFESPIEIRGEGNLQLISAQVTATDPPEIPVKISIESNRINVAPFLSNPNDIVSFSVITGEELPIFKVKARIAGVKELILEDSSTKKGRLDKIVVNLATAIIGIALYLRFSFMFIFKTRTNIPPATSFITSFICGCGSIAFLTNSFEELGLINAFWSDSNVQLAAMLALFLIITYPFLKWWRKPPVVDGGVDKTLK
jgi:hypothetical protein